MVLTGNVWLWMTSVVLPVGNTVPGTNVSVLKGRRGPSGPGPGKVLLIKYARCRWTPCEPRYPTSSDVSFPIPFCTEPFHCWTYCAGAWGSNAVKLTVVGVSAPVPRTGVPKFMPVLKRAAGGVKLSACCVSGKTYGTLCRWLHQVFRSTGVKKIP